MLLIRPVVVRRYLYGTFLIIQILCIHKFILLLISISLTFSSMLVTYFKSNSEMQFRRWENLKTNAVFLVVFHIQGITWYSWGKSLRLNISALLQTSLSEDARPKHVIMLGGSVAHSIPEHPKRENIFSVSSAYGDAFLFQVTPIL